MSETLAILRRMADQIGINLAVRGPRNAILATAEHIELYWNPRMKAALFADERSLLSPIARSAIDYLATGTLPDLQPSPVELHASEAMSHADAA